MELNLLHNLDKQTGRTNESLQTKMPVSNKVYLLNGYILKVLCLFLGVAFTFNVSAQLTGIKTVGTGGDYTTLTAAITALNTVGVGTGGVTFSVKGGLNETVPNGNTTPNPDITAGLLITKGGTAANPIVIKWDSIGVKPILRAGTGISDYDFVLGIAGQDYITIDGLSVRENAANNTNAKRAEIGIGLFKEKYNPSTGNNGCQHVTIKNCDIRLTQFPNVHQNIGYTCFNSFSTGIKLTSFTATHLGSTSIGYFGSSNPNQGIITAQDVHSFNTVIGNLIDSCVIGISLGDGFYKSGNNLIAAGTGNIIGQLNGGNTITHFGPLSTVTYYYGSYYSTIAAIDAGGQHDFSIEYNTINGCVSDNAPYLTSMAGIYAGESIGGAYSLPRSATGLFKINHNIITNIDSRNLANNNKLISGINFNSSGENNQLASGSVEINDNNISNLYSVRGDCIAINSKLFTANITVPSTYLYSGFQTNGDVSISRNTISNISRVSPLVDGLISAIFWKQGSKNLYINNNKISNLTLGAATVTPVTSSAAGMQVIFVHSYFNNAERLLVEIKGNKLESCNVLATPSAYNGMTFSGIYLLSGGITNNLKQDTVINCNIANGGNLNSQSYMDMIRVDGKPSGAAVSTVNIDSCYIANDIRTGQHSTDNYGLLCLLRGIVCDNASSNQVRNITNNTITSLNHTLATGATFQQGSHVITRGIYTTGRYTPGNVTNISDNNITNFSGLSGGFTQIASNNASVQYRFAMTGIAAEIFNKLNIYRNNISGFNTGISQGYQADGDYLSGPCGITVYNNTPAYETALDIHNNFVSDLKAPAMRSKLAINGIAISGLMAKAKVNHNTIVLGSANGDSTGRLLSTTTGAFGVTGLLIASYYYNTQAYTIDYRNNIISINATAKNTGANMCVRNFDYTALKRAPLGTAKTTTGNTYFINPGLRNYIYGQGTTYNTTGGIRNSYALTGATTNATYNLVNDNADATTSFNTKCGLYKSFMSGKDGQSYAEADNTNVTPQTIPFVNTGAVPQNLRIAAGATSTVFNPKTLTDPIVSDDYFKAARGATKVTAGAAESNGTISSIVQESIDIKFIPVPDSICSGYKTLYVTIEPPIGKTIATGDRAPRIYFRRIKNNNLMTAGWVDANVMPTLAQNTATSGLSGWRWGNPVSVAGNVYKFYGDLSLLNAPPALIQGYTIEYFIIAETQDGLVTNWSSGDWSHNVVSCPSTVKLETYSPIPVPYDNVVTNMDSNSVQDRFSIYGGTDLKRGIELVNINVINTYTGTNLIPPTSASTAVATVCSGDSIQVTAHYTIIGDSIGNAPGTTHLFEVADNNTFTTGLQSFVQDDSTFRYHMISATPKYIRVSYVCGGSTAVPGSTTPFVTIQSSNVPVNTSAIPDQNSCASSAKSITLTSTAVPATLSRYNWVVDNQGKMYPATPSASTTGSAAISVTPTDVTRTGTWTSYVTPSAGSNINDLGYHASQLSANEASDLQSGKGLQLVVNKIVKLNGLNVKAQTGDGTTTNGFNISIYSETGSRLYTMSNSGAIADGTVKAFTFNNWYLSPGTYSLVAEATTPGTDPTGALANASVSLPIEGTNLGSPALFIQAGVSDLSIDTANNYHFAYAVGNEYSYFYDLDITAFCTSNPLPFKWDVSPASCCLVPLPTVGLIAPNAQSNDLSKYHCGSDVGARIYYFDSTITNKLLLAVYPNGNEWEPSVVMVSNNGLLSDSTHRQSNGTDSMEVMPYIVQIEHEPTLDTSVTVRLFYPLADNLFIQNHYPNSYWFKYEGSAQDILNNLNPTYLDGIQILMPSDTGTENGKPYVEFEGITAFSSFGFIGATTNTVLPINFNNFTVGINGCSAWVQWKSNTESNIASYEVEESFDGKTFVSLASFAAQGDNHIYTASLPTNISRGSCYYRLKMIDKKGIPKYSKTVVVNVNCEAEPSNIQAYPNPAKNNVNVTLNVEKGDYVLTFVNAIGQTVFQQPVKVNSKGQQLPVKNLDLIGKGSFILKLTNTISRESFITRLQML